MLTVIQIDSNILKILRYRTYIDNSCVFFFTQNVIFYNMELSSLIIQSNIKSLLSQSIFTSKTHRLFNAKLTIRDIRLKNIDTGSCQPFITPLGQIKIFTETLITRSFLSILHTLYKVRKCSVTPLMLFKINMQTFLHGLVAK